MGVGILKPSEALNLPHFHRFETRDPTCESPLSRLGFHELKISAPVLKTSAESARLEGV